MTSRSAGRAMRSAASILLLAACTEPVGGRDATHRRWDWVRMRDQPRYDGYGASAVFADGKAMQDAPLGTVARESDGAAAATPPDLAAPAAIARGADRFAIYCAVCHGTRADGRSLVAVNMDPPRPPSLLDGPPRALTAPQLYAVVTRGYGRMPPLASSLSARDRWAVVAYVAALQRGTVAARR